MSADHSSSHAKGSKKSHGSVASSSSDVSQQDLAARVTSVKSDDDQVLQLQQRIVELEQQVSVLKDASLRAQAELQNAKIRMEKESSERTKFATEMALLTLLPTIDNFQRALVHLPPALQHDEWVKGVAAIEQDLLKRFSELGLKRMDSLGQPVDPLKHEILAEGVGDPGHVTEIFEDGYTLHGKILRPAKVKVGTGRTDAQS